MKTYFVGNKFDGCWYARCMMPMIANGWDGDKTSLRGEVNSRERSAQAVMLNDVIVFQRPDEKSRVGAAVLLKKLGKKIVYDNDDTYRIDNDGIEQKITVEGERLLTERRKALDAFMEIADLVTTTTEFLAEEYRKISKNVVVLPNCIDEDDWSEPLRSEDGKVRIGVVGSTSANGDFDSIREALAELNKMDHVQLVLFGLPPKETKLLEEVYKEEYEFWESLNIEWQPLVRMEDYFDTLNGLKLDIMLIPRKDNYFNRCKSNIKFLEAAMCEIPCVAQGFADGKSPYQEDIKSNNGIIILDNSTWLQEIDKLIKNKKLRRLMGKNAKQYVLANYNIKDHAIKWKQAYESIK